MIERKLTEFQKSAREAIDVLLAEFDLKLGFNMLGDNETYLVGGLPVIKARIWVYEDEVELRTPERHVLLESPDFNSEQEMISCFVDELRGILDAWKGR